MATAVLDFTENQLSTSVSIDETHSIRQAQKTFYQLLANTLLTSVTNMTV